MSMNLAEYYAALTELMKSGGEEFPGLCGMNLPVLLEAMTMREAMKGSELVALLEESAKAMA